MTRPVLKDAASTAVVVQRSACSNALNEVAWSNDLETVRIRLFMPSSDQDDESTCWSPIWIVVFSVNCCRITAQTAIRKSSVFTAFRSQYSVTSRTVRGSICFAFSAHLSLSPRPWLRMGNRQAEEDGPPPVMASVTLSRPGKKLSFLVPVT
jgi:hypothetical protein